MLFKDLGTVDYKETWDFQQHLFNQILDLKKTNAGLPVCEQITDYNYLLFCEHPHVYTLGKSGSEKNLLIDPRMLEEKGARFYKIDRGGDITYHGPGQIVGYPIFDLEKLSIGLKEYIHKMEEAIILTLKEYGIASSRLEGASGVWLDADKPDKARKICAIGVKSSRYVTMHGFAFNVNTKLDFYNYINPCGFIDKGVTSMEKELGGKVNMDEVKGFLKGVFSKVFGFAYSD
ncbi:MAG: lipoyl(octanoyl) transferase LipB [Chlorobi bacterium]|nr:lipoyl(octanoyl) transferase LipB [Chlorobiota bacterium]